MKGGTTGTVTPVGDMIPKKGFWFIPLIYSSLVYIKPVIWKYSVSENYRKSSVSQWNMPIYYQ